MKPTHACFRDGNAWTNVLRAYQLLIDGGQYCILYVGLKILPN